MKQFITIVGDLSIKCRNIPFLAESLENKLNDDQYKPIYKDNKDSTFSTKKYINKRSIQYQTIERKITNYRM